MSDMIIEYTSATSFAAGGAIVAASINPKASSACKMLLEWKGARMLLAAYDPTAGWFNYSPGAPLFCPSDAKVIVEGNATGAIAWRSL